MAKKEDFTGAVNVSADITPVTRRKIDEVTPELWMEMSINQLWDQRIILNNRLILAGQSGHPEIVNQLRRGVNGLDALLDARAKAAEKEDGPELLR